MLKNRNLHGQKSKIDDEYTHLLEDEDNVEEESKMEVKKKVNIGELFGLTSAQQLVGLQSAESVFSLIPPNVEQ